MESPISESVYHLWLHWYYHSCCRVRVSRWLLRTLISPCGLFLCVHAGFQLLHLLRNFVHQFAHHSVKLLILVFKLRMHSLCALLLLLPSHFNRLSHSLLLQLYALLRELVAFLLQVILRLPPLQF